MTSIRYLSTADVTSLIEPGAVLATLAEGFKALSAGTVQAPPRPKIDVPGKGFALAMLAWMPARHIALKTVNVFEGNHAHHLPSHMGLISLFDRETGAPLAVMDAAAITGIRTAGGAVLSIDPLARKDAKIATVIGGGVQAREHVRLLVTLLNIEDIRVFARRHDVANAIAGLSPLAKATNDLEASVRESDIVCLTTSSTTPVIEDAWIKPGTHVTSVGFAPPGSEVPTALIERARICVETRNAFSPAPVGCAELAGRDPSSAVELGEVLAGAKPGRTSDTEVTLYKSMGNAMEDMVVANLVYETALSLGVGVELPR
ncbi:ornithine cyclodeaminase family protein [Hyphomicrobium sp. CS1BSMeth3]|uniref:ornithine cyclodeaminase family protein n=1 Tax=Hyphomicrobium sp. CS1BSMeth3 TaxID=1892844 RepID=UPI0009302302|nr:ornithine cyclodeaminase family protein [Hyphomicrobium sp. CS1BSMeth3]